MPNYSLALSDCQVYREDGDILLVLPKIIDLFGIPYERSPDGCDHYHYRNPYGDLAIACDDFARFQAKKANPRPYLCELHVESKTALNLGRMWVQEFVFAGHLVDHENIFKGCRTTAALTDRITTTPSLQEHVTAFLNWTSFFASQFGERHFYLRK